MISIIMGSKSDYNVMVKASEVLTKIGIDNEVRVLSVHRNLEFLLSELDKTKSKIIIAGAGGAAHLPGVCAAKVMIPVIGVPIRSEHLNGIDSLLSIVQMPRGVPVATVGINAAENAAILAVQILALSDWNIASWLKKFYENEGLKLS